MKEQLKAILLQIMKDKKISKAELSRMSGKSQQHLSQVWNGRAGVELIWTLIESTGVIPVIYAGYIETSGNYSAFVGRSFNSDNDKVVIPVAGTECTTSIDLIKKHGSVNVTEVPNSVVNTDFDVEVIDLSLNYVEDKQVTIKYLIDNLADEQRKQLFDEYCIYCGSKIKPCYCGNNEDGRY